MNCSDFPEREELLMLLDLGYAAEGSDHFQTIPCGNLCPDRHQNIKGYLK